MKCLRIQHIPFEAESTTDPIEISLAPEEEENWESAEPKTLVTLTPLAFLVENKFNLM